MPTPPDNYKTCGCCDGHGSFEYGLGSYDASPVECHECEGTGTVPREDEDEDEL